MCLSLIAVREALKFEGADMEGCGALKGYKKVDMLVFDIRGQGKLTE